MNGLITDATNEMSNILIDAKKEMGCINMSVEIKLLHARIITKVDEITDAAALVGVGPAFFVDVRYIDDRDELVGLQIQSSEICSYVDAGKANPYTFPIDGREQLIEVLIEVCKSIKATME